MARIIIDDDDTAGAADVYTELHDRELDLVARDDVTTTSTDGRGVLLRRSQTRLDRFDSGLPVEVAHWELPRWSRGRVEMGKRVVVHRDGRMVDA
jgi:hypothetical protein